MPRACQEHAKRGYKPGDHYRNGPSPACPEHAKSDHKMDDNFDELVLKVISSADYMAALHEVTPPAANYAAPYNAKKSYESDKVVLQ